MTLLGELYAFLQEHQYCGALKKSGGMARPRPEKKKSEPAVTKILPMELQVGDRLADETGDWEVIAPPYSTAGGRMTQARVQRIDEPASWEIRSWNASTRVTVKRATAEEGKR